MSLFEVLTSKLFATSSFGDAVDFCEYSAPCFSGEIASVCSSTILGVDDGGSTIISEAGL